MTSFRGVAIAKFLRIKKDMPNFFWVLFSMLFCLLHNVWVSKNQSNLTYIHIVIVALLSIFWYILISYCKSIMPRPLKWGILGGSTIILSENIHKNAGKVTLIFADSRVKLGTIFILRTDLGPGTKNKSNKTLLIYLAVNWANLYIPSTINIWKKGAYMSHSG